MANEMANLTSQKAANEAERKFPKKNFRRFFAGLFTGQRGSKISRVGSGHDPRDAGHFAGQAIMIRELFRADPRVKPADLAGGSAFFKLTAESHVDAVQAPRGSGPRVRQ